MSKEIIRGRVYVVGDNIDTDAIIPARYMNTMDPEVLRKHAMEDLDPNQYSVPFLNPDGSCDYKLIVAGRNFGCGSSREHAPIALRAAGVEAVVAQTFARIYYRNSVNGGIILPLESEDYLTAHFKTGDMAEIYLTDKPEMANTTKMAVEVFQLKPFGPVKEIIETGGLTAYNKRRLGLA